MDARQIKPVMGSEVGAVAVAALQLFDELVFRRFAIRDAEQKSDHQADLGTEEPVPLENEDEISPSPVGVGAEDGPDVMGDVRTRFFEEVKIMLSLECPDRIDDHFLIQAGDEGDEIGFERVGFPRFEDVAVDPFPGAVAGMKIIADRFDAPDTDGGGELEIEHFP